MARVTWRVSLELFSLEGMTWMGELSKMMPRSGNSLCLCLHPYQFHLRPRLGDACVGNWIGKPWLGPVECDCMLFIAQTEENKPIEPTGLKKPKVTRLAKARQLVLGLDLKHKSTTSHK